MVSVTGPTVNISYDYDVEGRRVRETDANGTRNYLIDGLLPNGQVVAETNGNGDLVAQYVFGLGRISESRGQTVRTFHTDGQGSTRQLSDPEGNTVAEYWYTAFGEELARSGGADNQFRYTGEQWDASARQYYLRARWVDPANGMFTSQDPVHGNTSRPWQGNAYQYAGASPVSFSDPGGEMMGFAGAVVAMMQSYAQSAAVNAALSVAMAQAEEDRLRARYEAPALRPGGNKHRFLVYMSNYYNEATNIPWDFPGATYAEELDQTKGYLAGIAAIMRVDFRFETATTQNLTDLMGQGDRNAIVSHGNDGEAVVFSRFNTGRDPGTPNTIDARTRVTFDALRDAARPDSRTYLSSCFAAIHVKPYNPTLDAGRIGLTPISTLIQDAKREMRLWILSAK
jgi:RHS repeat-associated protein